MRASWRWSARDAVVTLAEVMEKANGGYTSIYECDGGESESRGVDGGGRADGEGGGDGGLGAGVNARRRSRYAMAWVREGQKVFAEKLGAHQLPLTATRGQAL